MFLTLAASAALGMSATADAQAGAGRGRGGPPRAGGQPGAPGAPAAAPLAQRPRVTGWGPAALFLRQRDRLQLTDEQVRRLEALANAPRPRGTASDLLRARADLMDAMQGDGNLTAAKAAMDRMASVRTARALDGMKRLQEARAVLTPAQRAQVEQARRGLRGERMQRGRGGRGPGMGRGGMGGPGMGRGMGPGMGRGMGPGMGRSMGPGMGRGMGRGVGPGAERPAPGQFPMLDRLRERRGMPPLAPLPPEAPVLPEAPVAPSPSATRPPATP
jgi:Spy/CpxP family protein refolding chaperone